MLRLLQLSDCHLRADPRSTPAGRAPEAALRRLIDSLPATPWDAVVLSGDLVDEAEATAYDRLERLTAGLAPRRWFLPGNHDDPAALAGHLGEAVVSRGRWVSLPGLHLALLDSHCPGEVGGLLGEAQRAWLTGCLDGSEGPVLVFLHHPPVPVGSAWLDAVGLFDREAFLACLAPHRRRILGIAFGHVHQPFRGRAQGIPCFGAPSTWIQFAPCRADFAYDAWPPGARAFTWDGERLESRCLWARP